MAFGVSKAMLLKVLLVNLIVQQLEGNVISPWIMGRRTFTPPSFCLPSCLPAKQAESSD